MELTQEQIREVGIRAGLSGSRLDLFCAYVTKRGFIRDDSYIREWAGRFVNGSEYVCSDNIGRNILNELKGGCD